MPKHILSLLAVFLSAFILTVSCSGRNDIIPEDTMSQIYYDMYLTDEAVDLNYQYRRMADTLNIYEPVFNRYGYTSDDFRRSVNFYLERPDRFENVFANTKSMLEKHRREIESILEAEGKRPKLWPLIDSLELYTSEGIHIGRPYKNLRMMFFKPDSLIPDSPVIDSAFMERPVKTFLIFNDSALNADDSYRFYKAKSFMDEIKDYQARQDSIMKSKENQKDSIAGLDMDSKRLMMEEMISRHNFSEPRFMSISPEARKNIRNKKMKEYKKTR